MQNAISRVEAELAKRNERHKVTQVDSFAIRPEWFRLFGYAGFWVTVGMGIFLTDNFSGIDKNDTLLKDIYGYNNICVNFDFSPSTKVLPTFWAYTEMLLLSYLGLQWLAVLGFWQAGQLSSTRYNILTALCLFTAVSTAVFSVIFAVPPTGPNRTMWIHTLPFLGLQVGLVVLAYTDTLVNQWALDNTYPRGKWAYCVTLTVVVVVKQTFAYNALFGMPSCKQVVPTLNVGLGGYECQGAWFEQNNAAAQFFDAAFMLLAAVGPFLHSLYLVTCRRDDLYVVDINVSVGVLRTTG